MNLDECELTLNKIPGMDMNYSDHVGLHARFKVQVEQSRQVRLLQPWLDLMFIPAVRYLGAMSSLAHWSYWNSNRGTEACSHGSDHFHRCLHFSSTTTSIISTPRWAISISLLATCVSPVCAYLCWIKLTFFSILLTTLTVFCFYQGVIGLTLERKALKAAKQAIHQELNN